MFEKKLSRGERLVIYRRREGLSQAQAAKRYKVGRKLYARWERDEADDGPDVFIGSLYTHERAYLSRRRADVSRQQVADSIGVSAFWVTLMERGKKPCDRLLEFWEC